MSVLVAMSGGVDSSVAAALLHEAGHEVVGVTLRLWGGESDTGCCSVSDVDDARRVADNLGIDHHVFNLGDDFDRHVVVPYVADHAVGRTPNPCVECNRHIKFDRLLGRAHVLGFDQLATGHHAQIVQRPDGTLRIARAIDRSKDQSYVLHMLEQHQLDHLVFPVGHLTKDEVRAEAFRLGLRIAAKPDSQDVCFITRNNGRAEFLARRIALTPGRVVEKSGHQVGRVDAVELVTVGQRHGMDLAGGYGPRYATEVDVASATVTVGEAADLLVNHTLVEMVTGAQKAARGRLLVQTSAHGTPRWAEISPTRIRWEEPTRRVAPGQSVVFYEDDEVVGGGLAV